jgi:hypothetical protein
MSKVRSQLKESLGLGDLIQNLAEQFPDQCEGIMHVEQLIRESGLEASKIDMLLRGACEITATATMTTTQTMTTTTTTSTTRTTKTASATKMSAASFHAASQPAGKAPSSRFIRKVDQVNVMTQFEESRNVSSAAEYFEENESIAAMVAKFNSFDNFSNVPSSSAKALDLGDSELIPSSLSRISGSTVSPSAASNCIEDVVPSSIAVPSTKKHYRVEKLEAASTSEFPKAIRVQSQFRNLQGRYVQMSTEHEGYPAYHNKETGTYIFHAASSNTWFISTQLGGSGFFNACKSSEKDVRKLVPDMWESSDEIQGIEELAEVDSSSAVNKVVITSKFSNLAGGYVRVEDVAEYPAYYCKESGNYLAHSFEGFWYIGRSGDRYFSRCKSDLSDVRKLSKSMWEEGAVDTIDEVTWAESACSKSSNKFEDSEFPPVRSSLTSVATGIKDGSFEWIRASELNRNEECILFGNNIQPSDVIQGHLGNCWLISAMACIAAYPQVVENLFDTRQVSSDGKYTISLFDAKSSKWTKLCIDDYIPCEQRAWWAKAAKPLFAQSKTGIIWPMLLEKAFAKLWGSYGALQGGVPTDAWMAMTGCPTQLQFLKQSDWKLYKSEGNTRYITPAGGSPLGEGSLWENLKHACEKSYLVAASMHNESDKCKEKLYANHSYSVLQAVEKGRSRYIKMRNPWGVIKNGEARSDEASSAKWTCPCCSEVNRASRKECHNCGHNNESSCQQTSAARWTCPGCDEVNRASRHECMNCGRFKDNIGGGIFYIPYDEFEQVFDNVYVTPMCMSDGTRGSA